MTARWPRMLAMLLCLASPALAQTPPAAPGTTAADVAGLRARLDALDAMIFDPAATFSASKTLEDLRLVEGEIGSRAELARERKQVLHLIGIVEYKRGDMEAARDALLQSLAIDTGDPVTERIVRDHYLVAGIAADQEDYDLAIAHYRSAADLADGVPGLTDDEKAGIREKLGYVLHEAKRYQDALAVNTGVLATGERLFGADSPKLMTVLTNLAQNAHALGRPGEAEAYLQRCRGIARASGDVEKEQDMLFQLGVLAFETGQPAAARTYMKDRIKLLAAANEPDLLDAAKQDYAELLRRLGK